MDILGSIVKDKINIRVDNKKIKIDDLYIFFKGKIFNKDILNKKYKINESDDENLIKRLYEIDNLNFVNDLDGNFCIIIYDEIKKKLYLIKDKLGSIFIYYYFSNNIFIFSTSLSLIANSKMFNKQINVQALSNYLGYMFIYEPLTIYENTFKLEKGTILEFSENKIIKNNYYNLFDVYKKCSHNKLKTEDEYIIELESLFNKSVQKLGNKKNRVGVFMSGGKDSTLLAKLASKYYVGNVNTYTLGFTNERDESNRAKKLADEIGTHHHSIIIPEKDVLSTVKKSIDIYEEPFADPSIIPNIYMNEFIDKNIDFYITGEGNDAIFAYSNLYDMFKFKELLKIVKENIIKVRKHTRIPANFDELLQINIIRRFAVSDKLVNKKGIIYKCDNIKNPIRKSVLGHLNNTVSEKYRVKTGSLAKFHNYNYYTPYYDVEIIEKTFEMPLKLIFNKGKGKYIFDKILYKNLDKSLFDDYKKNGFGVPLVEWINDLILPEIVKVSKRQFLKKQNIFNYDELMFLIKDFKERKIYSHAVVLWNYYIFQLWYLKNMA